MQINSPARFARDGRADHVAYAQHVRAFAHAFAHGLKRVGGFARLAYGHQAGIRLDNRVAVTEFGGLVNLGRNTGQFLKKIPTYHAGVKRGAARRDHDAADTRQVCRRHTDATQFYGTVIFHKTAAGGVDQRFRLFMNFLVHEMFMAGFFNLARIPVNVRHFTADRHVFK